MFWHRARQVRETLLTASSPSSALYSLVSFTDGGLGIARDGTPLSPFYWPSPDHMDECVASFMRLAGLDPILPPLSPPLTNFPPLPSIFYRPSSPLPSHRPPPLSFYFPPTQPSQHIHILPQVDPTERTTALGRRGDHGGPRL